MLRFLAVIVLTLIVLSSLSSSVADEQSYEREELGFGPSYMSNTIPDRLQPGHSYPVMVTFKNSGLVVWESRTHRVGMVYGGDLTRVVAIPAFVEIPGSSSVPPGQEVTFTLSLLPVGLPGDYSLPFYVSYRTAQGDQRVTEVFSKTITIVPTDGISSPVNGSIVIESTLTGLEVFLGGISKGKAPCIIPDLTPGSYMVEIRGTTPERNIPVRVERGTLSRVLIDNTTAEPKIDLKKAGIISDGTLFGYIEMNIPLVVVVSLFITGCIAVMIHAVRLRREGEEDEDGKGEKKRKKHQKDAEDPAKQEKDLLDKYHSKPPVFDAVAAGSDPGSGSSSGGTTMYDAPLSPMKNVREFSRDMLDVNQPGGEKTGGGGGFGSPETPGSSEGIVEFSLKNLEVKPGSARAHVSALNQTKESLTVEGILVGPGISSDIPVDVAEPVTDEYEITISLKIFNNLGNSFYHHLLIPYNRGIALLARGVLEKAYEYYQGVIQKNPRQIEPQLHKAKILLEWGLIEEAKTILDQIRNIAPDNEGAQVVSRQIAELTERKEQEKARIKEKQKISGFPDSLSDRYTPIRLLGKDAFAAIILALRNDTGDLRALKIAHEEVEVGSSVYTEISVMYQLRHLNVLKMFRAEFSPNLFLELEYVSGVRCGTTICSTLADLKPPLSEEMIYLLIEQIASGLSYLHGKGVRHYHLSPKYILLDEPMVPKISGLIHESLPRSRSDNFEKTFSLAPEIQWSEKFGKLGKRTDIFQMGVILYWLMTGKVPYDDGYITLNSGDQYISKVYLPPGLIIPDFHKFDPLIKKLLALEKRDRYGSVDAFLAELRGMRMGDEN